MFRNPQHQSALAANAMIVAAMLVGTFVQSSSAMPPDLVKVVPADHLAAVMVDYSRSTNAQAPAATNDTHSLLDVAANIAQHLRSVGALRGGSGTAGVIIDALTSAAAVRAHPYAVVVTEAAARRIHRNSTRLSDLQAALIIRTSGENDAIRQQIQALLTARTDPENSTIDRVEMFSQTVYILSDKRLPEWAEVRWAAFGDYYVVGLGSRGFEMAALAIHGETATLESDDWFSETHRKIGGPHDQLIISIRVDRINEQLSDVLGGRLGATVGGLGMGDFERGLWTVGRDGRAITARVAAKRRGRPQTFVETIARPLADDDPIAPLIPDQARTYAIIEQAPAKLIRQVRDAVLAARSPGSRHALQAGWAQFASDADLDIEHDLLDSLGEQLVIHTYPRHPLRIPLMVTLLAPINGSADDVRSALDKTMGQFAKWLSAGASAEPQSNPLAPRLDRTDDGIWYIQAGVIGPAVTVHDQLLIVSFSPVAVRQVLATLPGVEHHDGEIPADQQTKVPATGD